MFNQFEDSVEDEKANQEAFERAMHFSEENKENRFKKLSFLNNKAPEEPEDEFSLVKPTVDLNHSPKIEIDDNFMKDVNNDKDDSGIDIQKLHNGSRSILGKSHFHPLNNQDYIDEEYDHKPIEFTKAEDTEFREETDQMDFDQEPIESVST
jgi:hypothetical protein